MKQLILSGLPFVVVSPSYLLATGFAEPIALILRGPKDWRVQIGRETAEHRYSCRDSAAAALAIAVQRANPGEGQSNG